MKLKQRRGKAARSLEIKFSKAIPAILLTPAEEPKIKLVGEGLLARPPTSITKQDVAEWYEQFDAMMALRLTAACNLFGLAPDDIHRNGFTAVMIIFERLFPGFTLRRSGSLPPRKPLRWTSEDPATMRCYVAALRARKSGLNKSKAWYRAVKDSELGLIADSSIAQAWKTFRMSKWIALIEGPADDGAFDLAIDMAETLLGGFEERIENGKN